ncbi:MAG TPA: long-chain-fatty-acid--CoA ligase [Umezawaea sp.]|nr:long-chain-fatty-acid--CoA ligase [Umezawaea sp.]
MRGLMQNRQLTLPLILHRAEEVFPTSRITYRSGADEGTVSFAEWAHDVRRLTTGLAALGLEPGDRVGTLGANSYEHLTLYFAVPCAGMVLHTVNHRLPRRHLEFVLRDAGVRAIFVEAHLLEAALPVLSSVETVEHIVVIGERRTTPHRPLVSYSSVLDHPAHEGDYPEGDESEAAAICYTSGTTGHPKGVVYSHRSLVLHALMLMPADSAGISEHDVVLPIVPMFHANAWGLPHAAVLAGADLVLPGTATTPAELVDQLETHRVSLTGGVATVWRDLLPHARGRDFSHLRRGLCGGGPLSPSLARQWLEECGVAIHNSWGMTELTPSGTIARLRENTDQSGQGPAVLLRAGTPGALVRLRVADAETGAVLPNGRGAVGEVQVSGPTVASGYHGDVDAHRFTEDGWLRTGDLGVLSGSGELTITDRLKDVIKSGGEWISTIDLENAIMENPDVAEAAVIGVPHERWDERPMAFVVPRPGVALTADAVKADLLNRVVKWWIPDDVTVVASLPRNSTGKISKTDLKNVLPKSPTEGPAS